MSTLRPVSVTARHRLAMIVALVALVTGCSLTRPGVKSLRDPEPHKIQFDAPISTTIQAQCGAIALSAAATSHRPIRAELGDARKMLEDLLRESGARELKGLVGLTVRVTVWGSST
jgi:hypothetical protein